MDFFSRQNDARRQTRRMLVLFAIAVIAIVGFIDAAVYLALRANGNTASPPALLGGLSIAVVAVIGFGSLYRTATLSDGGSAVARSLGATEVPATTTEFAYRRLRNVVEELSIASGVAMPEVFVLEEEAGINAFASGYTPADAAITVTRGALDKLTREELQGVIGHEFSHVLNGDMRLNIRLMGLLFGIMVLAIVGQRVIWFGGGRSSRRDGGGNQVWMIGLALIVVGYIGYFFARLIQAAVARSRESLADASAVQFTRQTDGIAGALKKIAVLSEGSTLQAANKQEVAHMLFGEAGRFNALFATHPPLLDRIRALQPGFREEELSRLASAMEAATAPPLATPPPAPATAAPGAGTPLPVVMGAALAAGQPGFQRAGAVRRSLPRVLVDAAQQPESALAVVLALAMSAQDPIRRLQQRQLADAFGDDVLATVTALTHEAASLASASRLPLAALAFPALKQLSEGRQKTLLDTLGAMVRADGQVDLNEYCLTRLLRMQLQEAQRPRQAPLDGSGKLTARRDSVALVCAVVARYGNADETAARRAWLLAMQSCFPNQPMAWQAPPAAWQTPFDNALDQLDELSPPAKELLIQGLVHAIRADDVITTAEAELLRVICASLHCPLPL
jgi:Zn-dependent protease with chaperone function